MGRTLDAVKRIAGLLKQDGYGADIDESEGEFYKARFEKGGAAIILDILGKDTTEGETMSVTAVYPGKGFFEKQNVYRARMSAHRTNVEKVKHVLKQYRIEVVVL